MVFFSFTSADKQMNKVVAKVWKGLSLEMNQIILADSLKNDIIQLNAVRSENELLGYACFTSAYACRVGGCAAPTNPNVNSYETFDYVVVYDSDMKILKVEIANYTGQYGYEICRQKWLAQFIGSTSNFKLEENIDGISGATVSATFLIEDLNNVGDKLKLLQENKLL